MGKTTEKLITFLPATNGGVLEVFEVRFINNNISISNRNEDATYVYIEISGEDWDEIVEFIKQQKG